MTIASLVVDIGTNIGGLVKGVEQVHGQMTKVASGAEQMQRTLTGVASAAAATCRKAGHPGMLVHDLRRSAVRNMERAGLSRSVAMQLTGHKTEAVHRRYAITSEADLREGVER